ncbi:MAG: hypothetical protein GX038_05975 [Erysipelothrix sp.]|nr:hypothetical protein [Erysipelothrix sp.]
MKKILSILLLLFVLVGCSSKSIEPVTNELLFTVNGKEIKETDIFESMKLSRGSISIIHDEAQRLLLKSLVTEDEAFDKKVAETLAEAKELIGDNFELMLEKNGFESEEDYVEKVIKEIARLDIVLTNTMSEDFEALKVKRPRYVRIIEVSVADGNKVEELAKAGETLEDLAKEYGVKDSKFDGDKLLVSEVSDLDTQLLEAILKPTEVGLIEKGIAPSTQDVVYIAEVVDLDADNFKDAAIEHFVNNNKLANEYIGNLFVKHKFTLYDQTLFDMYKDEFPDHLK